MPINQNKKRNIIKVQPQIPKRIFIIFVLILVITINLLMLKGSLDSPLDFGSFAASGINFVQGINPYDPTSPLIFEIYFPVLDAGGRLPNLNPPITLLFFKLITEANIGQAIDIWRGLSFILYIVTVIILVQFYRLPAVYLVWSLSLAGFWHTIELGQIYVPLLTFSVLIWILTGKGRNLEAGIFLGLLISVKPNFLIWVLILFAANNWRMGLSAMVTLILTWSIPLVFWGPDVYVQWLDATGVSSKILAMPGNSSLPGFFSRVNLMSTGIVVSIILFAGTCFFIIKHRETPLVFNNKKTINSIGIIVSLLASPISWAGYTILLLPTLLSRGDWNGLTSVSAIILSIPFPFILLLYKYSELAAVISGFAYTLPLILCLANELRHLSSRYVLL
jgi:hypothetical protein